MLTDITLLGGTSAVLVIGILIQIAKKAEVPTKYLPILSILVGIIVVSLGTWTLDVGNILTGLVLGALTSGLFDNIDKGIIVAKGLVK
jgi:small basic protein